MFKVKIVGKRLIDLFRNAFKNLENFMVMNLERTQFSEGDELLRELRQYPGAVKYPIRWASERQRRAFFASNGFGRGIPTQRTNVLKDGWKLITDTTGHTARLMVLNTQAYERYVTGVQRQPFHEITGWQDSGAVIERWSAIMVDRLDERLGSALEVQD